MTKAPNYLFISSFLFFLLSLVGMFFQIGPDLLQLIHRNISSVVPLSASELVDKVLKEITSGATSSRISISLFVVLLLVIYTERINSLIMAFVGYNKWIVALWQGAEIVVMLTFILSIFNILYIFGLHVHRRRWHWFMPGTIVGVSIWLLSSFGFKIYLTFFDRYSLTYGSIGAVIILLLWFYMTSIAILLGAVVNSQIEQRKGLITKS